MTLAPRILALVLALASGAAAAADVGRVVLAAGETTALRQGQVVRLALGTAVQDQDVLRTGAASNLQVRFADDSYVSLRESSELRVDQFRFTEGKGGEGAVFSLLKGGLRAVTGLIGRQNHDDYKMVTPTATIGIRGTDYAATVCRGDCRNQDGSLARDGTYGRVIGQSQGTNKIDVSNDADRRTLGISSNFFVADRKSAIELLLVAPDFVLSRLEGRSRGGTKGAAGGTGTEQAASGGAAEESRPSIIPPPLPPLQFVATQDLGPQGGPSVLLAPPNGWVVAFPGKPGFMGEAIFDDDDTIATYNGQNQLISITDGVQTASLAGGSIVDTGSLTLSNGQVFVWGRWTGATSVPLWDGYSFVQTTGVPLLFGTATGVNPDSEVVGRIGGIVTYNYVGGPKPVDGGGNVGTITSAATTVNFTTQLQSYSLGMNFPSVMVGASNTGPAVFNLSGYGVPNTSSSGGELIGGLSGTCSGGGCLTASPSGYFTTGFTGPNGYDFAIATGIVYDGTQAGEVAFLNLHQASSYTPGPPPAGPLAGQAAWSHNSPSLAGTWGLATSYTVYNGSGQPIAFNQSLSGVPKGSLGAGSIVEAGTTSLIDGGILNWGRWAGGQIDDPVYGLVTVNSGVPWVVGNANVTVPTSGTFTYNLAGGPNVVTNTGTVGGPLTSGAFQVSYGATQTISVSSPLLFSVGGVSYSIGSCVGGCTNAGGNVVWGTMNLTGTCTGGACSVSSAASGNAAAFLLGPQAGGLAVAGNVSSPAPNVTFAGAFKRP